RQSPRSATRLYQSAGCSSALGEGSSRSHSDVPAERGKQFRTAETSPDSLFTRRENGSRVHETSIASTLSLAAAYARERMPAKRGAMAQKRATKKTRVKKTPVKKSPRKRNAVVDPLLATVKGA